MFVCGVVGFCISVGVGGGVVMKYLYSMVCVCDFEVLLCFYCEGFGLCEVWCCDVLVGKFMLVFLVVLESLEVEIELIYNWDFSEDYGLVCNFGYLVFCVLDIYVFCFYL